MDKQLIDLVGIKDTRCSCGYPLEVTEDLYNLKCNNNQCTDNLAGRLLEINKLNNVTDMTYSDAKKTIDQLQVKVLLDVIEPLGYKEPTNLIEVIKFSCIYLVSDLAEVLFNGYEGVLDALSKLTPLEIYNRLPKNKEYCYEIYKQIQQYKDELITYEKYINKGVV